jgi:hypothetical protein
MPAERALRRPADDRRGAKPPGPVARIRRALAGSGAPPALTLRIAGRTRRTRDWTLSGVSLAEGTAGLARGHRVPAQVKVPGGPRGRALLEVIAVRADGRADLRFLEIATDCFLALAEQPAAAGRTA